MSSMIQILSVFAGATIGLLTAANVAIVVARLSHHDAFARLVQKALNPYARLLRMGNYHGRA